MNNFALETNDESGLPPPSVAHRRPSINNSTILAYNLLVQ